jgi:hypothetical protein
MRRLRPTDIAGIALGIALGIGVIIAVELTRAGVPLVWAIALGAGVAYIVNIVPGGDRGQSTPPIDEQLLALLDDPEVRALLDRLRKDEET